MRTFEEPGPWFFAPHATVITGAARLMLAMLQRTVTDAGGSYAFCDTDSMAIVTRTSDLPNGIPAISRQKVTAIQRRFEQLNPYSNSAVPRLLKTEATGLCYCVASKRYALYRLTDGGIELIRYSEHGLGHLQNPDPTGPPWIAQYWARSLRLAHGIPSEEPSWYALPALAQTTVTTPGLLNSMRPSRSHHRRAVKPFNFLTTAPTSRPPAGAPVRAGDFRLVGPWQPEPSQWSNLKFRNVSEPADVATYQISTEWSVPQRAAVDCFGDYLGRHQQRSEHKVTGGNAWGSLTSSPLQARGSIHLGKERAGGSFVRSTSAMAYGEGTNAQLIETLQQHLACPCCRSAIAEATGYSTRHLARVAKRESVIPSPVAHWYAQLTQDQRRRLRC